MKRGESGVKLCSGGRFSGTPDPRRKKERKRGRECEKKRSIGLGINYAPDSCSQKPAFVRKDMRVPPSSQ